MMDRRLLLAPFSDAPAVDGRELFGNANPLEVEIGCGKGAFLLECARRRPDRNFLGIEWQRRWVRRMTERVRRRCLDNLHVLHADAGMVIRHFLSDESVSRYHLYFPDPWWKRRHHKRRLVQQDAPEAFFRTLGPGGVLLLITDVQSRFEAIVAELCRMPFRLETGEEIFPADRPRTNYERKYRTEGRPLFFARLTRPAYQEGEETRRTG